ncbi:hypothetical protein ACCT30_27630, partial [Rhizobium ruizarguesonis]
MVRSEDDGIVGAVATLIQAEGLRHAPHDVQKAKISLYRLAKKEIILAEPCVTRLGRVTGDIEHRRIEILDGWRVAVIDGLQLAEPQNGVVGRRFGNFGKVEAGVRGDHGKGGAGRILLSGGEAD